MESGVKLYSAVLFDDGLPARPGSRGSLRRRRVQEDDFLYTGFNSRSKLLESHPLDFLLRELGDLGVYMQVFADDVVFIFFGQLASVLEAETNWALAPIWAIKIEAIGIS
ncbi:hypothetical protein EVAR_29529_1 [Eumeta japonica]|uniref:Reverse transcriptase domain-containing protein n=1 Tax=Eumeta variegata TaxID=151549 RepID=A0A4C1WES0_EUMVA|nr:hypothetical protein EVAR_29529_1 [Eumeta japonica]